VANAQAISAAILISAVKSFMLQAIKKLGEDDDWQ
jgi:hypothetical protein